MADDSRLTKRQLKKLVKEQTGIVKKDPNNLVARLKLAGALKDLGKKKDAVKHYQEVAKAYATAGKLVQAISVYKGILEIRPGDESTESALTELSAKRAAEIKSKSMPRLQQQDDGRWVMPTEDEVSEEEGTDPGEAAPSKLPATSPSRLRLPAPAPSEPSMRRRRGRRSRPRLTEAYPPEQEGTPSQPSLPQEGAPSQPEEFQPSLPSLAEQGLAEEMSPHEPPARVPLPPEAPPIPGMPPVPEEVAVPPAPPRMASSIDDVLDPPLEMDDGATADLGPEGPVAGSSDRVLTAEMPQPDLQVDSLVGDEEEFEEPTSPGPTSYDETIRKSAVSIDVRGVAAGAARSRKSTIPVRRTLVGVPMSEHPDLPSPPDAQVPPPEDDNLATNEVPAVAVTRSPPQRMPSPSPLASALQEDDKTTRPLKKTDATPIPVSAPTPVPKAEVEAEAEPVLPDEAGDETLGSVFDDEEEAFWSELGGTPSDNPPEPTPVPVATPTPVPVATPTPVPVATPTPAPVATPTPVPRPGKAGAKSTRRKSSKMTIPMGGAAFKKAVSDEAAKDAPGSDEPDQGAAEVHLEEIQLFRDLSETSREMLQSRMIRRDETKGAIIVKEGDPGNALFVVSSGRVEVSKQDRAGKKLSLATLGPGAFFGEFALLSDRKRHATVTVTEDGVFFEISRKVIADLTKSDPAFGNTLRQFYRRRLLGTLVHSAPFFEPLTEPEREALMGRLRFRRIPEGSKIITEGEPGGGFFLILIGEVKVHKTQPDGSDKELSRLNDGTYFGEMSLLKGGNAVASVSTVTPTEIVQLAAAEFYRILSKYPQIWEEVNREAKRRELANLQILSGTSPSRAPSDESVVM